MRPPDRLRHARRRHSRPEGARWRSTTSPTCPSTARSAASPPRTRRRTIRAASCEHADKDDILDPRYPYRDAAGRGGLRARPTTPASSSSSSCSAWVRADRPAHRRGASRAATPPARAARSGALHREPQPAQRPRRRAAGALGRRARPVVLPALRRAPADRRARWCSSTAPGTTAPWSSTSSAGARDAERARFFHQLPEFEDMLVARRHRPDQALARHRPRRAAAPVPRSASATR